MVKMNGIHLFHFFMLVVGGFNINVFYGSQKFNNFLLKKNFQFSQLE
jgi:hypothetical protein